MKKLLFAVLAITVVVACKKKDDEKPPFKATIVQTLSVTNVRDTSAVCWGKLNKGSNDITEYGIELYANGQYKKYVQTMGSIDSFGVAINGLYKGTNYNYKAYAIEANGTKINGTEIKFTTLAGPNFGMSINSVSSRWATVDFFNTENLKEWGVYYSTNNNVSSSDKVVKTSSDTKLMLTGLLPNTTYFILPYAIDSNNITAKETPLWFFTKCATPVLTLPTASVVSPTEEKITFSITSTGGDNITACEIRYSIDSISWETAVCEYAVGNIEKILTGLQPATRYKAYVFIQNKDSAAQSAMFEFKTSGGVPALAKPTVDTLKSYKTHFKNGSVTNDSLLNITEYGFCWSRISGKAVAKDSNFVAITTGSKETFDYMSYDLYAGTKYYVRAYAKNAAGTGYSEEVEITVPDIKHGPDMRDIADVDKYYKTVVIGNQTWMAENVVLNSSEIIPIATVINNNVCPTGWHIPSNEEIDVLFEETGGVNITSKVLKSQNGWSVNGTNSTGFGLPPRAGITTGAILWTSTSYYDSNIMSFGRYLVSFGSTGIPYFSRQTEDSFKPFIRCLKNN